jgi:hypothetical protein
MNNFSFNPITGIKDISAFPTEPVSEAAARAQFQTLFDQLKDFMNNTVVDGFNLPTPTTPTLLNAWVNYGSTETPIGYYKTAWGEVKVIGTIKSGVTKVNTVLFTHPVGYRPTTPQPITALTNTGLINLYVKTNGDVYIYSGATGFTWIAFNTSFRLGV